jgi:hypothetical protein
MVNFVVLKGLEMAETIGQNNLVYNKDGALELIESLYMNRQRWAQCCGLHVADHDTRYHFLSHFDGCRTLTPCDEHADHGGARCCANSCRASIDQCKKR